MANDDLGTHRLDKLAEAHGKLPKPKKWLSVLENSLDIIQGLQRDVPLGPVKAVVKSWSAKQRIEAAAWRWIRPQEEPELHDTIPDLQRRLELQHLHRDEFLRRLIGACQELAEREPVLRTHVAARIAEAEYRLRGSEAVDLGEAFGVSVLQLTAVTDRHRSNPVEARPAAKALVQSALAGICRQVAAVLDPAPNSCRVMNANLMVPISSNQFLEPAHFRGMVRVRAGQVLWSGYEKWNPHQFFLVVAETEQGPGFEGFWVPDIRHDGAPLPGAPRAFVTGDVQRLLPRDLPAFPVPDAAIRNRWTSYMRGSEPGTFTFDLCISIPIKSQTTLMSMSQPVGVVNVNVQSNGLWPRALSRSWRRLVAKGVEPWAAVLWPALGMVYACDLALKAGGPLPVLLPDVGDLLAPGGGMYLSSDRVESSSVPVEKDEP
jgi:hypothetical protein